MGEVMPMGWTKAQIGDLCTLINGKAFKPSDWKNNGLPIIRIQNLNNPNATFNHFKGDLPEKFFVKNGDLLFAWSGTPGTSFGTHIWKGADAVLNQHIFKMVFDEAFINKAFFRYAINQKLEELISKAHGGVGLRHVTKGKFEKTIIHFPPLSEQKRIAVKLDCLLAKVDACKARLDKVPEIIKRFRQSVLADATSGRLTEDRRTAKERKQESQISKNALVSELPHHWKLSNINDIVCSFKNDVRTGPFGSSLNKSEHQNTGIPVWGIESIGKNGVFTGLNKIFVTEEKAKELDSFSVKGGDIVISRSGTVGELCILPKDIPYGLISTNLMKISLNTEVINSDYFCFLFRGSKSVLKNLQKLCAGSTRLFLTQKILKSIDYPLPPLEEQLEIIKRVEVLFSIADQMEAKLKRAQNGVDKLTPSILAKSFRGELVPQDPNDEPAEMLLKSLQ